MARGNVKDALDHAVRSVARWPDRRRGGTPLALPGLTLSVLAIAAVALVFVAAAGAVGLAVLRLRLGRDGFADFRIDLRFDPLLKARLGAAKISAAYVGVTLATLAAAAVRGRATWRSLVAAEPGCWRARDVLPITGAILAYAVASTLVQVAGRERHLTIAGPTDVALLGTLVANLVVLAPIAEELFFRGWLYTALRMRWRFLPAFVVTAAAFASIHLYADRHHALRVLPLALALGLLREATGSIRPTIALHAAYNVVIVAITLAAA